MYSSTPAYWAYKSDIRGFIATINYELVGSPSAFFTYEQAGTLADNNLATFNSGGTGERDVTFSFYESRNNPINNTFDVLFSPFESYRVRGVAVRASGPWDNRSGQPVRNVSEGWYIGVEVYYPGSSSNGDSSFAFNYSAAGGTSPGQQIVNIQYYVPVTPGQTYAINVGATGGYVTFDFNQS